MADTFSVTRERREEPIRLATVTNMTSPVVPSEEATFLTELREPRDGLPQVTDRPDLLAEAVTRLAAGSGPIAVDAERASGYRYGQDAYLVQLRRAGSGTVLLDPVAFTNLSELAEAMADVPWVLHAASQDLPCLATLGLIPRTNVFDTEIAGRLLGRSRVGLAALVADELGLQLAKEHSAVDWSRRPLPESWLRYAALDVEVLLELADRLAVHLREAGKFDWHAQECAYTTAVFSDPQRAQTSPDRWRRTSGLHTVRGRRALAVVRALWMARDEIARTRDIHPGKVLPDAAITAAAAADARTRDDVLALPVWQGRGPQRHLTTWLAAIEAAHRLPEEDLPVTHPATDALPAPRVWPERNPQAAARLGHVKPALAELAEQHTVPVENLLTPEVARRLAWHGVTPTTAEQVGAFLRDNGARAWQIQITADRLADALRDAQAGVAIPQPRSAEPDSSALADDRTVASP